MSFANTDVILQDIVDESLIKFPIKDCISKSKAPSNSVLTKSVLLKSLED